MQLKQSEFMIEGRARVFESLTRLLGQGSRASAEIKGKGGSKGSEEVYKLVH